MAFQYSGNRLNTLQSLLRFCFYHFCFQNLWDSLKKIKNVVTGTQAFLVWVFPATMFSLGFKAHLHYAKYNLRTPS